jgi:hypothetical protein
MIFVFGSNLAGIHGAGAALKAVKFHGAVLGDGVGLRGESYAIPTKSVTLQTLALDIIKRHVDEFIAHAEDNPDLGYQVTRIDFGLAGYTDQEIAPMFLSAPAKNCFFDTKWRPILGNRFEYWGSYG